MRKKLLVSLILCLICVAAWCVILSPGAVRQPQINQMRIVIAIGIGWFLCGSQILLWRSRGRKAALVAVSLAALLTWTYSCNPFDPGNDRYAGFQMDSDALVFASVEAREHGVPLSGYGLGFYSDIMGQCQPSYQKYRLQGPVTDVDAGILQGYSSQLPGVVVDSNEYTQTYLVPGNALRFASGCQYRILKAEEQDLGIFITLEADTPMSEENQGALAEADVILSDGSVAPKGLYRYYDSQVGFQGKLASLLPSVWRGGAMFLLPLMCAVLFALLVVLVAWLLGKKYDWLLAGVFLVTFWLSPWVVNFSKSVYWVCFTWMAPVVIGLVLSLNWEKKRVRLACCLGAFVTILVKCLCGYEYTTFVMLGLILPMLTDSVMDMSRKDYRLLLRRLRVIFSIGICAVAGFVGALMVHGALRGEGNLLEGVLRILMEDGLRRTSDIDLPALNVLLDYFTFQTQIITGVDGSLFPLIAAMPLLILVYNGVREKRICWQDWALYVLSFLSSASWLILAKAHSHVHTHMNYICWYYWFIPVCFYLILKQLHQYVSGKRNG